MEEALTPPKQSSSNAMDDIDNRSHGSGFSNSQREAIKMQEEKQEEIAKHESRIVFYMRMAVLGMLLASLIATSVGVFFYLTAQEDEAFQAKFDADATKVLEEIGSTLGESLGAMDAFITQVVSYARSSNSSWPLVTVPHFAIHATKLLKLSKAFHFSINHFVEPNQKNNWESYANSSNEWIHESLKVQARDPDWHGANEEWDGFASYNIYDFAQPNHTTPYDYQNTFCPLWQSHPMVPSAGFGGPYNFDLWQVADFAALVLESDNNKRVVASPPVNLVYNASSEASVAVADGNSFWASSFVSTDQDPFEPFSLLTFPVYDSLEDVRLDTTTDLPFVAVIIVGLYWKEMIQNILPDDEGSVVVTFENICSPSFSYKLEGNKATYLGQGDVPSERYEGLLEQSALLHNLAEVGEGSSNAGLPLSEEYCPLSITVFPSNTMADFHKTDQPKIYAIITASIFLFTSLVFVLYDWSVGRRQRIVEQRALASGAIVSSLFPENVRDKLYSEKEQLVAKQQQQQGAGSLLSRSVFREAAGNSNTLSKPIAENFENTTIFFADIVGFTKWSASKSPTQVFQLLEAIYGKFDRIALRRNVFKVETIGDCYVAIAGVPEPQSNHATIIALFSTDCLRQLPGVLQGLTDTLGADTTMLNIRIGLHSGSVTAGVLRGIKGRFQLFGDSVNTAARMESNGQPGRIHCSESTAEELETRGKSAWVVPRQDKIVAKGKGELQTYWVTIPESVKSTRSNSSEA